MSSCWLWLTGCDKDGYGMFARDRGGKSIRAHRFSWELHFGPIPDVLIVLHKCDTPACVRPDHLFLGTHLDNAQDRNRKNRQATGTRHGSKTHPEKFGRRDNATR